MLKAGTTYPGRTKDLVAINIGSQLFTSLLMQESYRWWVYMYMRKGAVCRKWENSIELVVAVYNRESLPYIRQEVISQTQLNFSFFLFFLSPPGTAFIINALVYDICAFCAVPNKKAIHLLIDSRKMEKFVSVYTCYIPKMICLSWKNWNRISVIEFPSGNNWEWNQPERKRKMNHRGERGRHWKIF